MGLIIDFETYSECDIKAHGAWLYSLHPSTEILCLCYKVKGAPGRPHLWRPGKRVPELIMRAIQERELVSGHNVSFEMAIWENVAVPKYGFPPIPFELWRCTAAKAAYNGLPRKLEAICTVLELGDKGKDAEGHRVMLTVSKPRRNKQFPRWTPERDREKFDRLYAYCGRDVIAEQIIDAYCEEMPARETAIWQLDQKINRRGIPVDLDLCRGAVQVLAEVQRRATQAVRDVMDDETASPTKVGALVDWLNLVGGVPIPNLQAETVEDYLARDELRPDVREVLEARQAVSLASVKKYQAALNWAGPDGRCRDQHKYGAAGTLRWGGAGVQFQNLKRAKAPAPEVLAAICSGDCDAVAAYGKPLRVLSQAVRSMVKAPPGRLFDLPDYSSIEARLTYWFAGDWGTVEKFANGVDLYVDFAAKNVYNVDPGSVAKDSEERQVGKAAILGLGFGMGATKFGSSVTKATGKVFDDEFLAGVVAAYREAFPDVVLLWRNLSRAAMSCMRTGKTIDGDRWQFSRHRDWLHLRLPSGRKLFYFKPLSPSVLTENLVQATARDLMASALLRLDAAGFNIIAHVHDSIMNERPATDTDAPKRMSAIMEKTPVWAKGLPVAVEVKTGERMA